MIIKQTKKIIENIFFNDWRKNWRRRKKLFWIEIQNHQRGIRIDQKHIKDVELNNEGNKCLNDLKWIWKETIYPENRKQNQLYF